MRKILFWLLCMVMICSFTACGSAEKSSGNAKSGGKTVDDVINEQISEKDAQSVAESEPEKPSSKKEEVAPSSNTKEKYDIDLTTMSSTMVYSEVYQMMTTPADYIGKTVKMHGQFSVFHDDTTGKDYQACVIADATACCQQGLEFVVQEETGYPAVGSEITVTGTFETYYEGENLFCHLVHAKMIA